MPAIVCLGSLYDCFPTQRGRACQRSSKVSVCIRTACLGEYSITFMSDTAWPASGLVLSTHLRLGTDRRIQTQHAMQTTLSSAWLLSMQLPHASHLLGFFFEAYIPLPPQNPRWAVMKDRPAVKCVYVESKFEPFVREEAAAHASCLIMYTTSRILGGPDCHHALAHRSQEQFAFR